VNHDSFHNDPHCDLCPQAKTETVTITDLSQVQEGDTFTGTTIRSGVKVTITEAPVKAAGLGYGRPRLFILSSLPYLDYYVDGEPAWFDVTITRQVPVKPPLPEALDVLPTLKTGQRVIIRAITGEPLWGTADEVVKFIGFQPKSASQPCNTVYVQTRRELTYTMVARTDTIEVVEEGK
jgi:hypothetical protein